MGDRSLGLPSGAFAVGDVEIAGRVVLAPLSGYNDLTFRVICRRLGAALVYTGLISARSIYYSSNPLGSQRTEAMLTLHPDEQPVAVQLFAESAQILVSAACAIQDLGMAFIDINLGCAKPKIVKSGAGAALMREPREVGRIFAELSQALTVPVSGKIRLGWDDTHRNGLEVARAMADNGAALIAVHGRTAAQAYEGEADWDAIAEVKRAVKVPVLASGDVTTVAGMRRILEVTGCDGVMIGRGAVGNPWIFAGYDRYALAWADRVPLILEHLRMVMSHHGTVYGLTSFRKHLGAYMRGSPIPRHRRRAMMQCEDADLLEELLLAPVDSGEAR